MDLRSKAMLSAKEVFRGLGLCRKALRLAWNFTESDIVTFVLPNTVFGISGLFFLDDREILARNGILSLGLWARIVLVLLFNWCNTLIFNISNQRSPKSVQEDAINKPWRPIPSKQITPEQASFLHIFLIPAVLLISFSLKAWKQTAILIVLNWVYNDLELSDTLARNAIIALAFYFYYEASFTIATQQSMTTTGYSWAFIVCGIILTTMQVQDFKDQPGDQLRGRRTLPLAMGDRSCRWMTSIFIVVWAIFCIQYWNCSFCVSLVSMVSAVGLAGRLVLLKGFVADKRSWKCWSLWMAMIYTIPMIRFVF